MVEVVASRPGNLTLGRRFARLLTDPPRAAVLALCAVILALRRAEAVTNPQFWAEDSYFFERAYVIGWRAFALPFAGYLHTILRAIAETAVLTDPARAPAIFVACSAAVTLYVASRAMSPRCPLPRLGGACALAVVLVPDTYEVLLNVVNLQWVIGAGLVLLLISGDPKGAGQWAHDVAAAAAIGLTGPFCIILSPLFAWRAWSRRTRASAAVAGLVVGCALVQGYLVHSEPAIGAGASGGRIAFGLFLPAVGRRVGASILMGSLVASETDRIVATVAGIATLAGAGYLGFRPGVRRAERSLLVLAFFAMLAGSLYRTRYTLYEFSHQFAHARYVFIPQLIAIWLLLSAVGQKGLAGRLAPALCAWALLVNIPRYREPAYADMHWGRYEPAIRSGAPVTVPINPPGWVMPLPARAKR
jgi:hypothetical protein